METIIFMYITLIPVILAGILTMIWCKLPILKFLKRPIDGGKCLRDGKRIFGNNKTWMGLCGYLITNILVFILWGLISQKSDYLQMHNYFYSYYNNTPSFNLLIGLLSGLAYALFELPNSFLKRRLDIRPGKSISGGWKVFFIFMDQADSVIGCALVVWLFYDIGLLTFIAFILVGAITHMVLNMLLYFLHLRKNMF